MRSAGGSSKSCSAQQHPESCPLKAPLMPSLWLDSRGFQEAETPWLTAGSCRVWQSCTGFGTVEKARKIVLAFPASYAKLLQGLAKTTVLSQRIFNGVG